MAATRAAKTTKVVQCRVCGKDLTVNFYVRTPKRCYDCGLKATVANTIELHRHSGPAYDRWLAAMSKAALRWGWGTTPPAETAGQEIKT